MPKGVHQRLQKKANRKKTQGGKDGNHLMLARVGVGMKQVSFSSRWLCGVQGSKHQGRTRKRNRNRKRYSLGWEGGVECCLL